MVLDIEYVVKKFADELFILEYVEGEGYSKQKIVEEDIKSLFKEKIQKEIKNSKKQVMIFEYTIIRGGTNAKISIDLFACIATLPLPIDKQQMYALPNGIQLIVIKNEEGIIKAGTNL